MSLRANNLWRLRAPPVADAASRSASAAVEMRRVIARTAHFGHRKGMVGSSAALGFLAVVKGRFHSYPLSKMAFGYDLNYDN